jgi:hypothetical protein
MGEHGRYLRARVEDYGSRIGIAYFEHAVAGNPAAATTLVIKPIGEDDPIAPFLYIDKTMGQQLMDDLWAIGLRPSEGAGTAGAMAATQRHLDDARKLLFQFVDKVLGE